MLSTTWGHAVPDQLRSEWFAAAGKVEGDIRVEGHPKEQATFARVCG